MLLLSLLPLQKNHEKVTSWSHLSDWPASKLCGTAQTVTEQEPGGVPFKTKINGWMDALLPGS